MLGSFRFRNAGNLQKALFESTGVIIVLDAPEISGVTCSTGVQGLNSSVTVAVH